MLQFNEYFKYLLRNQILQIYNNFELRTSFTDTQLLNARDFQQNSHLRRKR